MRLLGNKQHHIHAYFRMSLPVKPFITSKPFHQPFEAILVMSMGSTQYPIHCCHFLKHLQMLNLSMQFHKHAQALDAVQTFLDDMEHQLRTNPDFKGQLGNSKC